MLDAKGVCFCVCGKEMINNSPSSIGLEGPELGLFLSRRTLFTQSPGVNKNCRSMSMRPT